MTLYSVGGVIVSSWQDAVELMKSKQSDTKVDFDSSPTKVETVI